MKKVILSITILFISLYLITLFIKPSDNFVKNDLKRYFLADNINITCENKTFVELKYFVYANGYTYKVIYKHSLFTWRIDRCVLVLI